MVLTQRALVPDLPIGDRRVVCLDDAAERAAEAGLDAADLSIESQPDDWSHILYTSGSTGQPKGTINLHRGLSNLSLTLRQAFDIKPGDVASIPPGHDAWVVGDEPVVMVDWAGAVNYAKS